MAPDQDSVVQFDRVTDSGRILQDLLGLSHQGLGQPIQFFLDSSYEYAQHLLKKAAPEKAALNIGRRKWIGSEFANHTQGELVLSITATIYYKNTAFTWWERLPAANITVAHADGVYRGWKPLPQR